VQEPEGTRVKCSKRRWRPNTGLCLDIWTLAMPNFKIDLGIGIE